MAAPRYPALFQVNTRVRLSELTAEDFGGDEALARLRGRLKRRGLRLILDFVPNHMAPDHPWVTEHPDFLVSGEEQLAAHCDMAMLVLPEVFERTWGISVPTVLAPGDGSRPREGRVMTCCLPPKEIRHNPVVAGSRAAGAAWSATGSG